MPVHYAERFTAKIKGCAGYCYCTPQLFESLVPPCGPKTCVNPTHQRALILVAAPNAANSTATVERHLGRIVRVHQEISGVNLCFSCSRRSPETKAELLKRFLEASDVVRETVAEFGSNSTAAVGYRAKARTAFSNRTPP